MAAPIIPPIKAWEELVGRPKYHVITSHTIAPARPANTTAKVTTLTSIMPRPIVVATAVPNPNAAMKLKNAAQTTAFPGESTRVETTVAIEFAASWKPLMKSNTRATPTSRTRHEHRDRWSMTPPPELPDRLYFKIGEVAKIVGVKPYVLRYWETEFSILRPGKTRSRHRLYRRRDVETLIEICRLLYTERYTIEGAKRRLRENGRLALEAAPEAPPPDVLTEVRAELLALQRLLDDDPAAPAPPLSVGEPRAK